jgi:BirA family biotin operon repressor/biotin-[acetyl-CoA-carboxylase] ligase
MSVLLRPRVEARNVGTLALVAGLALHKALAREGLFLKWPNDLLLKGRKCAGILLETEVNEGQLDWVTLGLGVNVLSAPEEGAFLGGGAKDVRDSFLAAFAPLYQSWQAQGFAPFREDWLSRAHPPGTKLRVKIPSNPLQGTFAGLDSQGNLRLRLADGRIKNLAAGEVYEGVP